MNIDMDWRYVSQGDITAYGGKKKRVKAWSKSGSTGKFVRSFPVAARVNNVVFVHAGIRSQFVKRGLEDLIKQMKTVTAKIGVDVIKQPTSLASANRCLAKPHSEKYVWFDPTNIQNLLVMKVLFGPGFLHGQIQIRCAPK